MHIDKKLFTFLKGIRNNNTKLWFEQHKGEFKQHKAVFAETIDELANKLAKIDPRVKRYLSDPKTVKIFRIYRDVRFAKNKDRYKTNFGATISPRGMENGYPGYYLHIEPGNSFVAGGIYMPSSERLHDIRTRITKDADAFRKVLKKASFKKTYGELDDGHMVKTAPRGYSKEDPNLDLLRYKSFTVSRKLTDKEVLSKDFEKKLMGYYKELKPLNDVLAKAIGMR